MRMMTRSPSAVSFLLLLLAAVLVDTIQSLSAMAPVDKSNLSAAAASSLSSSSQQQRRQESLNAGRDALLSLNLNLDALARGEHAAQAEALFTKIVALHQEGYYEVRPDTVSFNSVLKAHRNDPVRALEFWEANYQVRKDIRSYNSFLLSLANAGLAQDAYTLLTQMQMVNAAVRPDLISWNTVLLAYANANDDNFDDDDGNDDRNDENDAVVSSSSSHVAAAVAAEALIQTMIQAHTGNTTHQRRERGKDWNMVSETGEVEKIEASEVDRKDDTKYENARSHQYDDRVVPSTTRDPYYRPPFPNEISVATVMMAWSRHRDANLGARMAEDWLYRQTHLLGGQLPSSHAYAVTLQAYARCDDPDLAVQKVTDILRYMEETDVAAPTYNSVYHIALSIVAHAQGMEAAKQVFQRMARPDVQSYTRMIQMWGNYAKTLRDNRSGNGGSARHHHAYHQHRQTMAFKTNQCLMEILVLFRQMKKDPLALPNSITYTTTLNAIAETQLPNSGEIATALLRKMKQPTQEQYHAALKAVARSNHPGKVVQASDLLQEMITKRNMPPSRIAYNTILQAARTGYGSDETRAQNLDIGWQAFLALHELSDPAAVSSATYQRCLRIIETQDRHRTSSSMSKAKEVVEKCCANGCWNRHVLRAARCLFAKQKQELAQLLGLPVLTDRDDDDDDIISRLPEEWTHNALM